MQQLPQADYRVEGVIEGVAHVGLGNFKFRGIFFQNI
jgi:hypothetical protein